MAVTNSWELSMWGMLPNYPSEDDVENALDYAHGELTGNKTIAAEGDVRTGVTYGANGTEYTGTYSAGGGSGQTSYGSVS